MKYYFNTNAVFYISCSAFLNHVRHILQWCWICAIGFFHQIFSQKIQGRRAFVFGFFILNLHLVQQLGIIICSISVILPSTIKFQTSLNILLNVEVVIIEVWIFQYIGTTLNNRDMHQKLQFLLNTPPPPCGCPPFFCVCLWGVFSNLS